MPTATSWKSDVGSRGWGILVGYNLPFVLWTVYALAAPLWLDRSSFWSCPIDGFVGWCPGCGLTHAYARFLSSGRIENWSLCCVLVIFVVNALWSLLKIRRMCSVVRA